MKRLLVLALACCLASSAHASISIGISGPGSLALPTYEGPVVFPQIGFTGEGTITTWSVTGLDPIIKTVTYAAADLDFSPDLGSGFRWAETITNNSGVAWDDFHIRLISTTGTTSGAGNFLNTPVATAEVPGFATIVGNSIAVLSDVGVPMPVTGWTLNLSANLLNIDMLFPTPILPGASFQVHIPIVNVGAGGGTFVLSQQASVSSTGVVPEPATCVVWGLLGVVGVGVAWWNKKASLHAT